MEILKNVTSSDVKNVSIDQLRSLCAELREKIVDAVINCGGHLSSSLGAVELITALHFVFDFPHDKLIFDVGHQAYAHKLLTGRLDDFVAKLRTIDGIGAFLKRGESEYDTFTTGHAGVSVSEALGLARARDLMGEKYEVVAVVGDSSLANGMAFEAMNDSGSRASKHILVLNDNGMSISKAVGAMSSRLIDIRQNRVYKKIKNSIKRVRHDKGVDLKFFKKIKDGVKYMFSTGVIFEEFGYKYIGPIDGHDVFALIEALKIAKEETCSVILHVVTQKGKGCIEAEEKPDFYHGLAPMYYEKDQITTYSSVFGAKIKEFIERGEKVVSVCAGMPDGTGLSNIIKEYPERCFDVGIAEEHAVTMASGLARGGLKPYVAIYSTFLQRAIDSVVHDVVLQNLPVTICVDRAGIVGEDGETHQGIFDVAMLSSIPNLTIVSPASIKQFEAVLEWSINFDRPLVVRYPRGGITNDDFVDFEYLKWQVLGEDCEVNIVASGPAMVKEAVKCRDLLIKAGVTACVINATTLKPLDCALLDALSGKKIFVLEDNVIAGGLGSAVRDYYAETDKNAFVKSIAIDDAFVTQGKICELQDKYGVNAQKLYKKILKYIV